MVENDGLIERLWAGRGEETKMSRDEIAAALRPRLRSLSNVPKLHLWIYLGALLATLMLQAVNIAGYRSNPTMLATQIGITAIALGLATFGVYLMGEVGRLDRMDTPLAEVVKGRLAFVRGKYERWLWACAATLPLLTWAVNTMVDNQAGVYRINKPFLFTSVNVVMLVGMYGMLKVGHWPMVRELRAVLEDLESQLLDRSAEIDELKPVWRRWSLVLAILLTLMLLWGAWRAWTLMG